MLELKGELVFKTVAYHRAADAIGRSPVDLVVAPTAPATAPRIAGRRQGDQRQDRGAGDDRPDAAIYDRLRAEIPPSLVEPAADPGPRAQDRAPAPRGARASRPSTTCAQAAEAGRAADGPGHVGARPRQLVLEGIARLASAAAADAPRPGRGAARPPSSTRSPTCPGVALDRAGRLVPAPARVDRRPRPARRDGRPAALIDRVHDARDGRPRGQPGRRTRSAVRLLRGPQVDLMVDAARRGRHLPHPLHRLQGAQRPPARRWPATRAGACPRRASCGSARTASR